MAMTYKRVCLSHRLNTDVLAFTTTDSHLWVWLHAIPLESLTSLLQTVYSWISGLKTCEWGTGSHRLEMQKRKGESSDGDVEDGEGMRVAKKSK